MKETQLLLKGPMVRATLSDSKTQTRRIINHLLKFGRITEFGRSDTVGYDWHFRGKHMCWRDISHERLLECCPYGQPGDRLWGREAFHVTNGAQRWKDGTVLYRADHGVDIGGSYVDCAKWTPSIYMPRWASRITLEITGVRVERLQDISEADATAEGTPHSLHLPAGRNAVENYCHLWECINGDESWDKNPWVWVIEFAKLRSDPKIAEQGVNNHAL